MSLDLKTLLKKSATRHYVRVVAFVVLGICIGAFIVNLLVSATRSYVLERVNEIPLENGTTNGTETQKAYTLVRSEPVSLSIPAIHLNAEFEEPLGLNTDQTIEVPDSFETVGWYKYSPTPGELGPSVVLGHVDSYEGAAVFYLIGQLESGDKINITRNDGSTAVFEVIAIERYKQSEFPTEKVYGNTADAELRLITCSGTYNHETLRYDHNTVVYARLVEPEDEE